MPLSLYAMYLRTGRKYLIFHDPSTHAYLSSKNANILLMDCDVDFPLAENILTSGCSLRSPRASMFSVDSSWRKNILTSGCKLCRPRSFPMFFHDKTLSPPRCFQKPSCPTLPTVPLACRLNGQNTGGGGGGKEGPGESKPPTDAL